MRSFSLPVVLLLSIPSSAKTPRAPEPVFRKIRSGSGGDRYADKAMRLLIDVPAGYVLVPPRKNQDVAYQFAFRHPTRRFEVRVALSTLAENPARAKERAACAEKSDCVMADLDAPSEAGGAAVLFNVGGGDAPFHAFPPAGVKKEFAADWGYVSSPFELEPGRTFNDEGFKLGQVVMLHRNGTGTVYRIVLADDIDAMIELDRPLFYGVRFEGARPPGFPAGIFSQRSSSHTAEATALRR